MMETLGSGSTECRRDNNGFGYKEIHTAVESPLKILCVCATYYDLRMSEKEQESLSLERMKHCSFRIYACYV